MMEGQICTGLPSLYMLMSLFEFITPCVSHNHLKNLTLFQEFMLTLMRLRLNLSVKDLGYHFGIAKIQHCVFIQSG